VISDNMLLLHGNNRYHAKEHEYQGTDIVAENTYRAELGLKVYGKSTQNGVPSPENPIPINSIGDSGSVDAVVTGKNLIPTNLAQNGISYNADTKRWKFAALSKYGLINVRIIDPDKGSYILPAGQYTFTVIDNQNMLYTTVSRNDWKILVSTTTSGTFTLTEDTMIGIFVAPIDSTQPGYIQIQLERGATATSYQPYREPQTLTINTPNGLCGIPVDTGGNYTDSTGQQWVCDEIDFERGVYVQRIGKITSYNNEQLSTKYMSTTGKLTTGASVIYILGTPIETPLTAEELAAYKAIKSYPHYTHIKSAAELNVKLKEY
jgi:hypothetical protein